MKPPLWSPVQVLTPLPPAHTPQWGAILAPSEKNGPVKPDAQGELLRCRRRSPQIDPPETSLVLSCLAKKAF